MLARKPTRKARRRSSVIAKPRRCSAPTVIGQSGSHNSTFYGENDSSQRRMCRTPQPSDSKRKGGSSYFNYQGNISATNLTASAYGGGGGRLSPYPSSLYARSSISSCSSNSTHYFSQKYAQASSSRRSSARSEDMGGLGLATANSSNPSSRRSTGTFLDGTALTQPHSPGGPSTHLSATNPSLSSTSSLFYSLQNSSIPRITGPVGPGAMTSPSGGDNYHYQILRNNNGHAVTIALGPGNRPQSPHSPLLRPENMHLIEAANPGCTFGTLTKVSRLKDMM
ncbi:hypothetical protein RRG08_028284 [Elysia crispata]|uniref:Uncharacterized protein n=1 Tax=Elysia crispata TaxID=231223 RepID=A0AAE1AWC3_9GAST|nr:hypothetical protein RRG08_028284 [Elysia crispata]